MQIQFDATLDEWVDVTLTSLKLSPNFYKSRRNSALISGILIGLGLFVILPATFEIRIVLGIVSGLIVGGLYWLGYERSMKRQIRSFGQNQLGANKTFSVRVELDAQGMTFEQFETRITYLWASIQEINIASDRIDITTHQGQFATIRTRAFATPAQQKEFIDLMNQYRQAANQPTV